VPGLFFYVESLPKRSVTPLFTLQHFSVLAVGPARAAGTGNRVPLLRFWRLAKGRKKGLPLLIMRVAFFDCFI